MPLPAGDREFGAESVPPSTAGQRRIDLEILSAEPALDRNLPKTGGAEQQFVLGVFNQGAARRR